MRAWYSHSANGRNLPQAKRRIPRVVSGATLEGITLGNRKYFARDSYCVRGYDFSQRAMVGIYLCVLLLTIERSKARGNFLCGQLGLCVCVRVDSSEIELCR